MTIADLPDRLCRCGHVDDAHAGRCRAVIARLTIGPGFCPCHAYTPRKAAA